MFLSKLLGAGMRKSTHGSRLIVGMQWKHHQSEQVPLHPYLWFLWSSQLTWLQNSLKLTGNQTQHRGHSLLYSILIISNILGRFRWICKCDMHILEFELRSIKIRRNQNKDFFDSFSFSHFSLSHCAEKFLLISFCLMAQHSSRHISNNNDPKTQGSHTKPSQVKQSLLLRNNRTVG